MRKVYLLLTMLTMSILLVACGSTSTNGDVDKEKPVVENIQAEPEQEVDESGKEDSAEKTDAEQPDVADNNDEVAKMDRLNYVEFELKVEYPERKEYEVKLEKKHDNRVEAKIEDELNGTEIKGTEAFEQLYPIVEQLQIMPSTSKEEAIQQILDAFQLNPSYEEFELEITFKDNTKIEFKDKK